MMSYQEVASLIAIRNFLASSIENLNVKLSRDEIKEVQQRVKLLDKVIVGNATKMDLNRNVEVRTKEFISSEDTKVVLEKIITNENKTAK